MTVIGTAAGDKIPAKRQDARQVAPVGPHREGCDCTRCRGFEPGNLLAVKSGAYSRRLLEGDAHELLTEIELAAPEAAAPVLALAAMVMAQFHRADAALRNARSDADLAELKRDAHRWAARAESLFARMGLLLDRGSGSTVNVSTQVLAVSPEWQSVKARIAAALEPYPAALEAVRRALEGGP